MKISFVFPALNEEKAISQVLQSVPVKDAEIIVVDGGSTDSTVKIAKTHNVKVIPSKKGYGRQIKKGIKLAEGDLIVVADSDGSYPLHEINRYLDSDFDFITFNRFANLENNSMRFTHNIGNRLLTSTANILFNLNLKDSQSGMWLFKRSILPKLNLRSNGMSFSEEIKIEAFKKTNAFEVSSSYKKRIGAVKLRTLRDGLNNLLFLFKKRFRL